MPTLNPGERRSLRAKAHALKPVVIIGESGLTPAVMREIDLSLNHHELIKVKVVGEDRARRENALKEICASLNAVPVQHIGKILVIYRKTPEAEQAKKPRAKPGKRRQEPRVR